MVGKAELGTGKGVAVGGYGVLECVAWEILSTMSVTERVLK